MTSSEDGDADEEAARASLPRRMQAALEETVGAVRATPKATEREFRGLFGRPPKPDVPTKTRRRRQEEG